MTEAERLANLDRHLDMGWNGKGWPPSVLRKVGCGLTATTPSGITGARHPKAQEIGSDFLRWVIDTARQRWREGYWADPFTNSPQRRT